jgi:predicted phosphodiesterase
MGAKLATLFSLTMSSSADHLAIESNANRIIVVGDVHGCLKTLQRLLLTLSFDPKEDLLIFAGDLINKGPDSLGVIRFLMNETFCPKSACFSVKGNHEVKLLKSKLPEISSKLTPQELQWIKSLPLTITVTNRNLTIVHAGLLPNIDKTSQSKKILTKMRSIDPRKMTPIYKKDVGIPWAKFWNGPEFVIFGHDSPRGLQVGQHYLGIDTGCVGGGSLSAAVFDQTNNYRIIQQPNIEQVVENEERVTVAIK